ncbi:glycoside hydrolase family 43 protein [Desmospora activa]|uniref:Arabinanase n=1 Tax=Desmospora activa DSM 45169 TaxID=1121389 RepID=A0A2T4Z7W8_9BACL|nr:glycoside hydrolase family 43 protein [Desmospora activa]PTM57955.1 arabinanase [Desmospora activa DSM 45169]
MGNRLWRKLIIVLLITAFLFPQSLSAHSEKQGAAVNEQKDQSPFRPPVFQEASVHDPSVIRVNDTFYVFGSHLAAAKTDDWMRWETIASGVDDKNKLIPNVKEELKETFDWAETDTLWAPDVIQLEDGRFYLYYNACRGDSPRSALGVAVADDIEGPYRDQGIILKSGMWGEPSEDGTIYDARIHPNVVDPDAFFDKEGNFWMVYGSYSGGIFILKMDPETGKPLPGQGYGKKLTGGNHSRIEGPYIQYSPDTDYYYLFLSFGGLDANGGYNIRVARSKNPDGPYYDAEGNNMIDVKADPDQPLFDDRSIEPYGVKLMGNFRFQGNDGPATGYVSPGHNSTYYDPDTDQYFLIFHTRFPERGEEHEVRVHPMFINEQGWPVVAPYRYSGETVAEVSPADVIGDYQLINHGKDISTDIKESKSIRLESNGTISGEVNGKWKKTGPYTVKLTVDQAVYHGVFLRQWDPVSEREVMTVSALSKEGVAIWGSRIIDREVMD